MIEDFVKLEQILTIARFHHGDDVQSAKRKLELAVATHIPSVQAWATGGNVLVSRVIGESLRQQYQPAVDEPLPQRLIELLLQADRQSPIYPSGEHTSCD